MESGGEGRLWIGDFQTGGWHGEIQSMRLAEYCRFYFV